MLTELLLTSHTLTGPGSVIDKPAFTYTQTQKVGGLAFTIAVTVILVSLALLIAYRNFGPPARRARGEG